tara:strand:+ start:45 stop:263 length:219 start_codon:yes stop_codon:yes gene_type:complete
MSQQQFTTYMELVGESTVSFDGVMSSIWKRCERFFLTVGYARAASELARQGYHVEAKKLMMELSEIREDFKR